MIELAAAIRARELSPVAVTDHYLRRTQEQAKDKDEYENDAHRVTIIAGRAGGPHDGLLDTGCRRAPRAVG